MRMSIDQRTRSFHVTVKSLSANNRSVTLLQPYRVLYFATFFHVYLLKTNRTICHVVCLLHKIPVTVWLSHDSILRRENNVIFIIVS